MDFNDTDSISTYLERFHLDNLTTLFVNFNASFTILPLELIVQITVNSRIKFPIHLTSYLHYQIRNAFLRYRNTLIFLNHFYIFVIYYVFSFYRQAEIKATMQQFTSGIYSLVDVKSK